MSATKRRAEILERIAVGRECPIGELAACFNVSEMTVRRDLDALAAEGRVVRTHGGAMPASGVVFEFRFLDRAGERLAEKEAIAARAADLVPDGATVALDSGTTTLAVARALRSKSGLTVITTSLPVASELQYCDAVEVILLGGRIRRDAPDLTGALTLRSLEALCADIAFLGADAVDAHGMCYQGDIEVAHLLRTMATVSKTVYVVADSSKVGRTEKARVGALTEWGGLITDDGLDGRIRRELRSNRVNVLMAKTTKRAIARK